MPTARFLRAGVSVEIVAVSMRRVRCPWTGRAVGRTLGQVESERMSLEWSPGQRLTPWLALDLPRAAWIVERRAAELTAEERQIVRDAAARMLRAVGDAG
jgi:hypothetical protein